MKELPDNIFACWGQGGTDSYKPGWWFTEKLDKDSYDIKFVRGDIADDLAYCLNAILQDLPPKKDWLDPSIERHAKAIVKKYKGE